MASQALMRPMDADKLLATFLDLVRLDSPSGQEGPVRDYLITRFEALKLPYTVDAAGNILVTVPGHQMTSDATAAALLMTGHMDVVPPCIGVKPVIEGEGIDRLIRSSGDTVLGADCKAGLAPLLEAVEVSMRLGLPRPPLLLAITVEEETFLQGAKAMDPSSYSHCAFSIALDTVGEQGTVIYQAASYVEFTATVYGKSVHAGIMPEKGINAIQLLSKAVDSMPFGRLDEESTSNIGFVQGGKATNIVPDQAQIVGEIRSHDESKIQNELARIQAQLNTIVSPIEGASFDFTHHVGFTRYETPRDHPYLQAVIQAIADQHLPLNLIRSNGGSDVNVFAQHHVPGVVLSAGYIDPHTLNERVYLRDMVTCGQLLLAIWARCAAL